MKKKDYRFTLGALLAACAVLFSSTAVADGQAISKGGDLAGGFTLLINEVEADPGNQQNDSCQYIELRGVPGTTVPANTYFVAIDSDAAFPGRLHHVVPVGGVTVGSNGLIYLRNTVAPVCPNRTAAAGTTVVDYNSVIRIGGGNLEVGSESFAIITTTANIFAGLDIDANDDGVLDISVSTVYDAVAFLINPDEHFVYPNGADQSAILGTPFQDVPDAFVRFPGNDTPRSAAAFYYGELATSPVEAVEFVDPRSANFPTGGVLTPGAPNVPAAVPSGSARADFDGDGRTDISVFRGSEGNWYLNRSTAGFQALNWGISTDTLVPADFDGDGKADTAVFRATDVPGATDFFILNSNGFTVSGFAWGNTGDTPTVADYDGDGRADVGVYRPSNGTWYIILSSNGSNVIVTNPGTTPVPADYTGDGLADGVIFTNGSWVGTSSTGDPINIQWGQAGDIPTPGDFDGDGKVDQAVFRPSTGTWYVLQSSNGQPLYIVFGASSDIPVAGDYDGDGKDDAAIYRNGQWWINRSSGGVTVANFGIATDKPVPASANP